MKRVAFIFVCLSVWLAGLSQTDSNVLPLQDTPVKATPRPIIRKKPPAARLDSALLRDTTRVADTLALNSNRDSTLKDTIAIDTLPKQTAAPMPRVFTGIDSTYAHFLQNPLLPMNGKGVYQLIKFRENRSEDELFYLVAGLVLFLAFIKLAFSRYFKTFSGCFYNHRSGKSKHANN